MLMRKYSSVFLPGIIAVIHRSMGSNNRNGKAVSTAQVTNAF